MGKNTNTLWMHMHNLQAEIPFSQTSNGQVEDQVVPLPVLTVKIQFSSQGMSFTDLSNWNALAWA